KVVVVQVLHPLAEEHCLQCVHHAVKTDDVVVRVCAFVEAMVAEATEVIHKVLVVRGDCPCAADGAERRLRPEAETGEVSEAANAAAMEACSRCHGRMLDHCDRVSAGDLQQAVHFRCE